MSRQINYPMLKLLAQHAIDNIDLLAGFVEQILNAIFFLLCECGVEWKLIQINAGSYATT